MSTEKIQCVGTIANLPLAKSIVSRTIGYIETEGFLNSLVELIKRVIIAAELPSRSDADITKHAMEILQQSSVKISVGGVTNSTDFAQYDPIKHSIFIQGGWVAEMHHLQDCLALKHGVFDEESVQFRFNRHFSLGIIKVIHEFAHSLTRDIMKFVGKDEMIYFSTPVKIGTIRSGGKLIGDMGFGLEEVLSGKDIRFNVRFTGCEPWELEEVCGHRKVVKGDIIKFPMTPIDFQRIVDRVSNFNISPNISHFTAIEIVTPRVRVKRRKTETKSAGSLFIDDDEEEEGEEEEEEDCDDEPDEYSEAPRHQWRKS